MNDKAFEMAAAAIRFGVGVTREVGCDLADLGVRNVLVVTDPTMARLPPVQTVLESLAAAPGELDAVAHRIVHGGRRFRDPVLVDDAVEQELTPLVELAPLHMTPAVTALGQARAQLPGVPHVAVFDSAFHATIPNEAATYALPRKVRDGWGIRRYGFHGLSVQWASEQVQVERLVVCHLGGGCSVTAVRAGRSVDTTMGFTPLEGVPMATRPGSVDPGSQYSQDVSAFDTGLKG